MPDLCRIDLGHQGRLLHSHADRLASNETTLTVSTCKFREPMTVPAACLTVSAICLPTHYGSRRLCQW